MAGQGRQVTRRRSGEVINDQLGSKLAGFHKEVLSGRGVFVNIGDWEDARGRGGSVQWWSLWSPTSLEDFDSVQIACANYRHGILYRATEYLFQAGSRMRIA